MSVNGLSMTWCRSRFNNGFELDYIFIVQFCPIKDPRLINK